MVPIPPPPTAPSGLPPRPPGPVHSEQVPYEVVLGRPGQITSGWRWTGVLGWAAIAAGLFALADALDAIGKPTWWLDPRSRAIIIFLAPAAAILAFVANRRWTQAVGILAALALGASALADRSRSPGAAVVEAGLALAGLLITEATFAGRIRPPEPPPAGSPPPVDAP